MSLARWRTLRGSAPVARTACAAWIALVVSAASAPAWSQSVTTLDGPTVWSRVAARSPSVRLAEARIARARELAGTPDAAVRENPSLSVLAGPRFQADGSTGADVVAVLSWPFDLSGARGARREALDAAVRAAEAEAAEARLAALFEARSLWCRALAARARMTHERARSAVESEARRIATERARLGAAAQDEVALAAVALATADARVEEARAAYDTALEALRAPLGLAPGEPVDAVGDLVPDGSTPDLATLRSRLPRRPDVLRAGSAMDAANAEAHAQSRLGVPVPRLALSAGHEGETFGRAGVETQLPVFQRNQLAVASARAQARYAEREREALLHAAEVELRVAWVRHDGAMRRWQGLREAMHAADEAEHMAQRIYELGQRDLLSTLVALRETAALRTAHLDAAVAVAEARLELERAAGGFP